MHAVLALEQTVGVGTLHHHGSALHAGFIAVLIVQHLHGHAVVGSPLIVHAVQHFGPVLCLGAAGAGVEGEDGVAVVVLAVQHRHELQLIHCLAHSVHGLLCLGDHGRVVFFIQHFQHGLGVIVQALQLFKTAQLALQVAHLIKHLFAQVCIIVKAGAGHGMLQLLHALAACFNGQCFFQVLNGLGVLGQLHFQFISRDHSLSSSRSRVSIITDNVPGRMQNAHITRIFCPAKRHSLYTDTSLVYRESVIK